MTLPHLDLRAGRTAIDLPPLMPLAVFRVTSLPGTRIIGWQGSRTAIQPLRTCGPDLRPLLTKWRLWGIVQKQRLEAWLTSFSAFAAIN